MVNGCVKYSMVIVTPSLPKSVRKTVLLIMSSCLSFKIFFIASIRVSTLSGEVLSDNTSLISAGCSLGAYHAVNFAFRYPHLFKKVIGISGRYDLTLQLPFFNDLFDSYWDENIYYNMPCQYIANLWDEGKIKLLQSLEIILVVGKEDAFLEINHQLSESLHKKNINNILYLMEGEAHKAAYWGKLMQICL